MRILVVPSGFKESLGAKEAADVMKEGILKVMPLATVETLPMVDGGEGFTEAIINITGGKMYEVQVTGPVGDEVQSYFGVLKRETVSVQLLLKWLRQLGYALYREIYVIQENDYSRCWTVNRISFKQRSRSYINRMR